MSHLLTRSLLDRLIKPKHTVCVEIGRSKACAALARLKSKTMLVNWQGCDEFPRTDTTAFRDITATNGVFNKLVDDIKTRASSSYQSIRIGLPDPIVQYANFEFDELPGKQAVLNALIRKRFSHEHHLDEDSIVCSCQSLQIKGEKPGVIASAVDKELIQNIEQVFADRGMLIDRIDSVLAYKINLLFSAAVVNNSGAFISLESDYWTIVIWDDDLNLRFIKSRWRETGMTDRNAEIQIIATEAERIIRTYIHADDTRHVEQIYLSATDSESDKLRDCISLRTRDQPELLERLPKARALLESCRHESNALSTTMLALTLPI